MATKGAASKLAIYERATGLEVEYLVYQHPKTKEKVLVPSEDDISSQEQWIESLRENAKQFLAEEDEEIKRQGNQMLVAAALQQASLNRKREAAEGLRPFAQQYRVDLVKPDFRSYIAAKQLAVQQFPDQESEEYDSLMALELLPIALRLDDASELDADEITLMLWRRLKKAMYPSQEQLIFFQKLRSQQSAKPS